MTTPTPDNTFTPRFKGWQTIAATTSGGGSGGSTEANVKTDFGAEGDGVTNDTAAFVAMMAAVTAGTFSGMYAPEGRYLITPGTINTPTLQAWHLRGDGAPIDTNYPLSRGTILQSDGTNAGKPLININGSAGFKISDLTVWGNTSASITGASNGIRIQNVAGSGLGSGTALLEQVVALWCAVGFDAGSIDGGTDGIHDTNNAGDVTFLRCLWSDCTEGLQANQDQNVNFDLTGCQFFRPDIAIHIKKGGSVSATACATYDAATLLQVDSGGANVYHRVQGLHCDGSTVFTKLFEGPDSDTRASFHDIDINVGQMSLGGTDARFTVGVNNAVQIVRGCNLCNAAHQLFEMRGGSMLVEDCALPADSAKVVGTIAGGQYRVQDCYDEATWNFLPRYGNLGVADGEVPTGAIDGANKDFTLGHAPSPAASLHLFKNGLRQKLTTDYTLSGSTISYVTAPALLSTHQCDYSY